MVQPEINNEALPPPSPSTPIDKLPFRDNFSDDDGGGGAGGGRESRGGDTEAFAIDESEGEGEGISYSATNIGGGVAGGQGTDDACIEALCSKEVVDSGEGLGGKTTGGFSSTADQRSAEGGGEAGAEGVRRKEGGETQEGSPETVKIEDFLASNRARGDDS